MLIKKVEKDNYKNIYDLVKTAFETAKVKDGTELEKQLLIYLN